MSPAHLPQGCLALIVATAPCRRAGEREARARRSRGWSRGFGSLPPGQVGKVVQVLGPALWDCGCCVSAMPTWCSPPDPRGYVVRASNLMRLDGGDEVTRADVAAPSVRVGGEP